MNRSLHLVPPQQSQRPPVDLQGMCARAIQFHQRGELAEAERIYRQILELDPHHADSLHLLGVLAHQVGRDDVAVELIRKAIARDKRPAAYHSNLGTAFQALGRLDEAAACYERALAIHPELAEAQMNLGAVLEALGKRELAEARFRRALALCPDLAEAHVNLGNILQAQGKLAEAVASHQRALTLKPGLAEVHGNLGNALQAQGKLEEAAASYRRALELKPEMAEVLGNLGNTLLAQNKLGDAEACYARALELKPEYAEGWYNLGNLRQAQNPPDKRDKLAEAVACYERAIQLKPQLAEAHYNLGNTLHTLERLEEAAASFERALALRPEYAEAHYNLGCVLENLGRLEEALRSMATALEIQPGYPQARFGQALAQLRRGDYASGWRNYESRWQSPDHDTPWRAYPQPLWRGEKLASGRLLLWGEQGIGDETQFAGLIPEALRTGNSVVLDCDARLQPLFARSFPGVEVVSGYGAAEAQLRRDSRPTADGQPAGTVSENGSRFCRHCLALSQGRSCGAGTLPRPLRRWAQADRASLADAESKTSRRRSIALERLAPLFALSGIRWISLQYGTFNVLEEQAAAANAPLLIDRGVDQFANIDCFAAQVAAMDQVITIDNSTAHLAAALGRPVWLLLPFAADWRWLEARQESPWYPTLRLFRQSKPGDWEPVVEKLRASLGGTLNGL